MTPEQQYERLVLEIDRAIQIEIGEEREFKDETESLLSEISDYLVEALGLPKDFHL